jgi:hypothetical protein
MQASVIESPTVSYQREITRLCIECALMLL